MTKTRLSLSAIALIIFGIVISNFWHSLQNPMRPLYVEIVNATDQIIPTVVIEHGTANLQEKILLLQLKPKEERIIALNHLPGVGFNIAVNYVNGEKSEICSGKKKDHWIYRQTITKTGIYTTAIR